MFNLGPAELLAIVALALILLGPDKLPGAVRSAGRAMGELRRITGALQQELTAGLQGQDPEPDEPRDA